MDKILNSVKNHPLASVTIVLVVALVIGVVSSLAYVNGIRDEGIRKEADLITVYNGNQAELTAYTNKITESMGVADAGTDAADRIIGNAIQGRYDGNMEPGTEGSMFSAIQEAYPDVAANTELYANVQRMVESGRDSFKGKQMELQSRAGDYETWLTSGLFRSQFVKFMDFPSDRLKVTVNGQVHTGQDALDKMREILVSDSAANSFDTGTTNPVIGGEK